MAEHVVTMVQLIVEEHVFAILMIRGTVVPLASLPGLPTLKKRWPVTAVALNLVQKSTLFDFVWFCVYNLFKVLLTLDRKMFCHSYATNAVAWFGLN